MAAAVVGLLYLVSPGVSARTPGGVVLMSAVGVAWGVYSLRGRGLADPLAATAGNFLCAAPMALALSAAFAGRFHPTTRGALLAVASGALTSGIGYVIWYAALKHVTATRGRGPAVGAADRRVRRGAVPRGTADVAARDRFGGNPRRHRARARQPRARQNRAAGAASARHARMNAGRGPLMRESPH